MQTKMIRTIPELQAEYGSLAMPRDVWLYLLINYLDGDRLALEDLNRLRAVCRQSHMLINNTKLWETLFKKWFPIEYSILLRTTPEFNKWDIYFHDRSKKLEKYFPLGIFDSSYPIDSLTELNNQLQDISLDRNLSDALDLMREFLAQSLWDKNPLACAYYQGILMHYLDSVLPAQHSVLQNIVAKLEKSSSFDEIVNNPLDEMLTWLAYKRKFISKEWPYQALRYYGFANTNNQTRILQTDSPALEGLAFAGPYPVPHRDGIHSRFLRADEMRNWAIARSLLRDACHPGLDRLWVGQDSLHYKPTGLYLFETASADELRVLQDMFKCYTFKESHLAALDGRGIIADQLCQKICPTEDSLPLLVLLKPDMDYWFWKILDQGLPPAVLSRCLSLGAKKNSSRVVKKKNDKQLDIWFTIYKNVTEVGYPWREYLELLFDPEDKNRWNDYFFITLCRCAMRILVEPQIEFLRTAIDLLDKHGLIHFLPKLDSIAGAGKKLSVKKLIVSNYVIGALLHAGAEIHPEDRQNPFWVTFALQRSQNESKFLEILEYGFDLNITNEKGETISHLIAAGPDTYDRPGWKRTYQNKLEEKVKNLEALHRSGADFSIKNHMGISVWDILIGNDFFGSQTLRCAYLERNESEIERLKAEVTKWQSDYHLVATQLLRFDPLAALPRPLPDESQAKTEMPVTTRPESLLSPPAPKTTSSSSLRFFPPCDEALATTDSKCKKRTPEIHVEEDDTLPERKFARNESMRQAVTESHRAEEATRRSPTPSG